jgi:DNA gyrase inhibitor GyrI
MIAKINKGEKMSALDVRIVTLEPMRVACSLGFGPNPEELAHKKMLAFLQANGLMDGYGARFRHFGFNNPSPSPGSPNYGYEIWVTVPEAVEGQGEVVIKQFPGGLYAVARFENLENIGRVWHELVAWRENCPYKQGQHQWLENLINPLENDYTKYLFDLYLPIEV